MHVGIRAAFNSVCWKYERLMAKYRDHTCGTFSVPAGERREMLPRTTAREHLFKSVGRLVGADR